MHNKIFNLLAEGATIITPSRSLSYHLSYKYGHKQTSKGKKTWLTPDCLSWEDWCRRNYKQAIFNSNEKKYLLNDLQQQYVVQKIIKNLTYKNNILQIFATTKQVIKSYGLCKKWDVVVFPKNVHLYKDAYIFRDWFNTYERQKALNGWLDLDDIPNFLIENIGKINNQTKIVFYDFNFFTTQQKKLIFSLNKNNLETLIIEPSDNNDTVSVCSELNQHQELKSAATWAKNKLKQNPNSNIGIVVRNLVDIRDEIDYVFTSILTPKKIIFPEAANSSFHSISLGKPLSDYPLIKTAIDLISLGSDSILLDVLADLLHSPFIKGADAEMNSRAIFYTFLRNYNEQNFSFSSLLKVANKYQNEVRKLPIFIAAFKKTEAYIIKNPKLSFHEWTTVFSKILVFFGWPGDRKLNSKEHQSYQKWQEILFKLNSLDSVEKSVSYSEALLYLSRIVSETNFQPKTLENPIQIMEVSGAAGMQFDYLWVMGMDNRNWPKMKFTDSFVPLSCQRQFNIPYADFNQQLKLEKKIINKLAKSSKEVIFSYSKQDGDCECFISPLIKKWSSNKLNIKPDLYSELQLLIKSSSKMETFIDNEGLPIKKGHIVSGGSGLFKDQAACPFRAFVIHRLHATPFMQLSIGLSPIEKGNLVHSALQYIWQDIKSLKELRALPKETINVKINYAIKRSIDIYSSKQLGTLNKRLIKLESLRLYTLLIKWLDIECERSDFEVISTEKLQNVLFRGIQLNLRLDRIDKLADGSLVIIDYKTGSVNKKNWDLERLLDPQLPLYAVTNDGAVSAISYASLKKGALGFIGQSNRGGILPDINPDKDMSWADILLKWQKSLSELADEICQGRAVVEPFNNACNQCHLQAVCRIYERIEDSDSTSKMSPYSNG